MQDEAVFEDLAHIKLYGLIGTTLTQRVQLRKVTLLAPTANNCLQAGPYRGWDWDSDYV